MFREASLLNAIAIIANTILSYEQGQLCLLVNFLYAVFDFASGNTLRNRARPLNHQVARLYSQCIDSRILILKFQDKVNHRVVFPTAFVIVVINQDRVRPAFTSHVESRSHKLVVAFIAAKGLNYIAISLKPRMIKSFTITNSPVHHFYRTNIGVMPGNSVKPIRNGFLGFIHVKVF